MQLNMMEQIKVIVIHRDNMEEKLGRKVTEIEAAIDWCKSGFACLYKALKKR